MRGGGKMGYGAMRNNFGGIDVNIGGLLFCHKCRVRGTRSIKKWQTHQK